MRHDQDDDSFSLKDYLISMEMRLTKTLDEINEQSKITNSRITELEKWRSYVMGALAIAIALGLPNFFHIFAKFTA